ncbi:hypothetical protein OKA05_19530 [Luteolibacter arcticus]|uniref:Entericidin n=1 Tax=Luteolibacter arcticus TaxID=1581411 RepID=A0ABT3GML9_9BACT|nr:hypothetical protein [Luteolibacter arcticus]MCW1924766.1 hypothetical protein [Luteolibacter arcticus]
MKTIFKLAGLSLAVLAFGNCTYVEPTGGSSATTTTTTESDGWGNSVTTEETITTD